MLSKPLLGFESADDRGAGHVPVSKLFNPCGAAAWLFTELDPEDGDSLFGLANLGVLRKNWILHKMKDF